MLDEHIDCIFHEGGGLSRLRDFSASGCSSPRTPLVISASSCSASFPPSLIPVRRREVCHAPQHVRMFLPEDPLLRLHDWKFQLLSLLPISNFKEYWSIICPSLAIARHQSPQQGIVLIGHFYMRNKCSTECIIFPGEDKIDRG